MGGGRAVRTGAGAVVLACVSLTLAAGTAGAAHHRSIEIEASVHAPAGYRISFAADGSRGPDTAAFIAFRPIEHGFSAATYLDFRHQRVTARDVHADLGPGRKVHAKFAERSRREDTVPGCRGRRTIRRGVLIGRISFVGEHRYVAVRKHRIPARVTVDGIHGCRHPSPRRDQWPRAFALSACRPAADLIYGAFAPGNEIDGDPQHFAATATSRGSRVVARDLLLAGKASSFEAADDLSTATVHPGGPFDGTGTYADGRLTGDLAATFLGLERPLAITPAEANLKETRSGSVDVECGSQVGGVGIVARQIQRLSRGERPLPPPRLGAALRRARTPR